MENSQLLRFRRLFESQIQSVASSSRDFHQNELSVPTDTLDQATLLQEQVLLGALENRKVTSIQGAKAALERIRKGSFGICEECGEDIDLRRLEIHPTTLCCVQCQEESERRIGA
jgi:DnaK suppressor protein